MSAVAMRRPGRADAGRLPAGTKVRNDARPHAGIDTTPDA
jgi:hypothetical protein